MQPLSKKEFDEILARKPESRYKYFIRTVTSEEEVWGLADEEGWLMLEVDGEKEDAIAVFPLESFAEAFREAGELNDFFVEPLDLHEFMEWLDDFEEKGIKVAVFPTPNFQSAVMRAAVVRDDFEAQFDKEETNENNKHH
jgi:hypothetical protein